MLITINGRETDIVLDSERTVGDVAAGVERWLSGSGFSINAVEVNKKPVKLDAVDEVFTLPLENVESIDIKTCTQAELCIEALLRAEEALTAGDFAAWRAGASASFLSENEPEIYKYVEDIFQGKVKNEIESIIAERERELFEPVAEFLSLEGAVEDISRRLLDLSLDTQTGKDARAAETVRIFSDIAFKILRLLPLLRLSGVDVGALDLGGKFFEELYQALKEFFIAYQSEDTILSGDLAEYEIAPRLESLYGALKNKTGEKRQ